MLNPELITEETIATLYDHLEGAGKAAQKLLNNGSLSEAERDLLFSVFDGWTYCAKIMLNGQRPHRER